MLPFDIIFRAFVGARYKIKHYTHKLFATELTERGINHPMANVNRAAVIAAEWWAAELASTISFSNSNYFDPTPVKIKIFRNVLIEIITLALTKDPEVTLKFSFLPDKYLAEAASAAGIVFNLPSTRTMKVRENGYVVSRNGSSFCQTI